jgi:hypothetical protein
MICPQHRCAPSPERGEGWGEGVPDRSSAGSPLTPTLSPVEVGFIRLRPHRMPPNSGKPEFGWRGVAQRERGCDAAAAKERETVWLGDRKWEKDRAGWRGPYAAIWTHQDRVPASEALFSAGQVTCLGAVVDGRAMNKYEFAKPIAGRLWVETIFADAESGVPVRFETRGRNAAEAGSTTVYRHDPAIGIDPPAVDLDERWAESLRRLSQEAEKGDPACRAEFFAAVERGRKAAFQFEIKGSFESGLGVTGIFAPSDAIQYRLTSFVGGGLFGDTIAAGGRAWTRRPDGWVETLGRTDFAETVIRSLLPPSDYVGQVRCLGRVPVDGSDHDAYEYDFYRDNESARGLYSHRSMLVETSSGVPVRNVSVSRRHAHQWMETRRYDPSLAIQVPPPPPDLSRRPAYTSMPPDGNWPPSSSYSPPFVSVPPADAPWPPPVHMWPPPSPFWPPRGRD